MNINNKEIEIDAEGYLVHPENWNKEVALVLAKSENIMVNAIFQIIFFVRLIKKLPMMKLLLVTNTERRRMFDIQQNKWGLIWGLIKK
jgi:sulfur relay (sulfurtransferase) DsrC/TusE family protein